MDSVIEYVEEQLNDEWIPVSKRLPEGNKPVLLYLKNDKDREIQLTSYLYFTEKENFKKINNEFCINDGNAIPEFVVKEYVKAWRELPEEYMEKYNEG